MHLRHLEIYEETVLPKGIGSVSSLRTLSWFYVGRDEGYGGEVGAAAATIGDLGNLNNLQGSLRLSGLKNVKDGSEGSKAELRNKKRLIFLSLNFMKGEGTQEHEVIEALEPCHNLEGLEINYYSGKLLRSSIASSLSKLRVLYLSYCDECEELPPLGQLPSLEKLLIRSMRSCKKIGKEFLGIKRSQTTTGGGRHGKKMASSVVVAFPKLKELQFHDMPQWTKWGGDDYHDDDDGLNFKLFPCLHKLEIYFCQELKSLPQFITKSPVQILKTEDSPILQKRCPPDTGEDWFKISHIPNITVQNQGYSTVYEIKDGQLQHLRMESKEEVEQLKV